MIIPPIVDAPDLAGSEMLSNSWVVLAHTDWTICAVMVWQCYQGVPIPVTSMHNVWVRIVWLASALNDRSPPIWLNHRCRDGMTVLSRYSYIFKKQLFDLLLLRRIILPPIVDAPDLVRAEMLSNYSVVIAHTDWTICTVMDWHQCFQGVPIPITSLHKVLVTVGWPASASNDHSPQ